MNIEVRRPTDEEIKLAENWPIWSKEVSEFSWSYSEKETCLILEGSAEVTGDNGETAHFSAGDRVVFPAGLNCTWKIKKEIKKRYKFG